MASAQFSQDDLPLDSDIDVEQTASRVTRPVHLTWRFLGIVSIGGAIGTAIRESISLAVPLLDGVAWITLVINVLGAFFLGALLEAIARRGADAGRRRTIRLLLGTGLLGGFTTYSTLATATATLLIDGNAEIAVAYAVTTLLLGAAGTTAGITIATAQHRRRASRTLKQRS